MITGPMTPRYLRETVLKLCIIVGAIVGAVGIVLWIVSGFSSWRALLVTALGAAIFFGFRYVKSLDSDFGDMDRGDEENGAP